jgi:hypothetical protein
MDLRRKGVGKGRRKRKGKVGGGEGREWERKGVLDPLSLKSHGSYALYITPM